MISPTKVILFSDAAGKESTRHTYRKQIWSATCSATAEGATHMRHNSKANAVYADGHAISANEQNIIDYWTEAYKSNTEMHVLYEDIVDVRIN
jgi:prepilin-type processing-associated H-X9-DG protein